MRKLHPGYRTIAAFGSVSLFAVLVMVTPAKAGGVTNIKEIVNNTRVTLTFEVFDAKPNLAALGTAPTELPANGGTWTGDLWIPWADNDEDFRNKRILIMARKGRQRSVVWVIWQSGEYVRYSRAEAFVSNAPRAPGEARSGGNRRMIIGMKNNEMVFTFRSL